MSVQPPPPTDPEKAELSREIGDPLVLARESGEAAESEPTEPEPPAPEPTEPEPTEPEPTAPEPTRSGRAQPTGLHKLIARARAEDGQPPFSDQSLVDLSTGARELLEIEGLAFALLAEAEAESETASEAEFVVDPDARRQGLGTRMLDTLIARSPQGLLVWAHGDHPAARALARSRGLEPVRELLQLRTDVASSLGPLNSSLGQMKENSALTAARRGLGGDPGHDLLHLTGDEPQMRDASPLGGGSPEGFALSTFRPSVDDADWLALNARAFATHPEQGKVSQTDLDELKREPWFEANDFLLLRADGQLVGYCWLKIEDDVGEFYVVGVDPERQGAGLGHRLIEAGLSRLAERGIRQAHLYVEADNAPALRLYRSYGFRQHTIDVQYRSAPRAEAQRTE